MAERRDFIPSREQKFGLGCLYCMMKQRSPDVLLNIQKQIDKTLFIPREVNEDEFAKHLLTFSEVYQTINAHATEHSTKIEIDYRRFFNEQEELEYRLENFMEFVAGYEQDIREKPFNSEDLVDFCAHISVFACMSLITKHSKEILLYAVESIASLLTYYEFDDAKFAELISFAKNVS